MAEITEPRPLSPEHNRSNFDCGRQSLNNWLQHNAWRNHKSGISRTNVICDQNTRRIGGYVSLSSAQIERSFLAKSHQRNTPDPIPATLLGQLAVDKDYQGQGHAKSLLFFALKTAALASQHIGSLGVLVHPLDDDIRAFYRRWGFQDLPFDPRKSMIARFKELKKSGIIEQTG